MNIHNPEFPFFTFDQEDCFCIADPVFCTIDVVMERDGLTGIQTICCGDRVDFDSCVTKLKAGISPIADHWEDGFGNTICWDNVSTKAYV